MKANQINKTLIIAINTELIKFIAYIYTRGFSLTVDGMRVFCDSSKRSIFFAEKRKEDSCIMHDENNTI